MENLQHHYADVSDTRLHYVTAGEGFPIVLLHGWPQTWYCWRHIIPHLSDKFRVIAPDLRGLGDSSAVTSGFDKRTVARDIVSLLQDELQLEHYHIVGHDWGGVVAYDMAAHFPGGGKSLTIIDVAIPGDGRPNISQGGRRWHHAFHQTAELPEALVTGREEIYLGWFYQNYGASALSQDEVEEYLRTYRQPAKLHAGFEYYRALAQDAQINETRAQQYRLPIPVLALGGGESWGRGAEVGESLLRLADNVELHVISGAGHWVPEEQPEEVVRHLLRFFDSIA